MESTVTSSRIVSQVQDTDDRKLILPWRKEAGEQDQLHNCRAWNKMKMCSLLEKQKMCVVKETTF